MIITQSVSCPILVKIPKSRPRFRPRGKTRYLPIHMLRPRPYSSLWKSLKVTQNKMLWLQTKKGCWGL